MIASIIFPGFVVAISWASVVLIESIGSLGRKNEEASALAPRQRLPWPELSAVRLVRRPSTNVIKHQIALPGLPLARIVVPGRGKATCPRRFSQHMRGVA
jgi:hypothetical protein